MNWIRLRGVGWTLPLNCIAALVSGNAARDALVYRDFLWAGIFSLIAIVFLSGMFLHFAQHPLAGSANRRLCAGGIYLFAAFTTALTVDDLVYMSEAGGHSYFGWFRSLLTLSLFGSLILGIAFLAVLIRPRYGYIAALLGATLSWPYFAYLSKNLPWRDSVWLVKFHWNGELQVAAILSLATATVYSIAQLRRMQRAPTITTADTR